MFSRKQILVAMIFMASISPFIFYSSPMKPWTSSGGGGTVFQEFIYPFEYIWHTFHKSFRENWNHYFSLVNAAEENQVLRKELALFQARIIDYENQVQETTRLRAFLGFQKSNERSNLPAEVMGSIGTTPFKSIRVSRGRLDGVKIGMPIIAPKGIVGRVIRTGLKFSDVQLLEDSNFHLDVIVERTRTRGVLQGISGNLCHLKLHKRADIKIGDTLITSGIVGGYPKGIPIGKVVKISFQSDNVSQVITVEPWVNYHNLEEVMVIKTVDKEVQEIMETAGSDWMNSSIQKSGG